MLYLSSSNSPLMSLLFCLQLTGDHRLFGLHLGSMPLLLLCNLDRLCLLPEHL